MAITYDNATTATTSSSYSHTCTGSDLVLFVGTYDNSGVVPTAVTYDGVSMTKVVDSNDTTATGRDLTIWMLANPSTGSNTVSITVTGALLGSVAISYAGAVQSETINGDVYRRNAPTSATESYSVTTTEDNSWTLLFSGTDNDPQTAGTGTTERASSAIGGNAEFTAYDSNGAITPAGSTSLEVTGMDTGDNSYGIMLGFAPAAPSAFVPKAIFF